MFFIAYAFKGQVHVFAGCVKIVSHLFVPCCLNMWYHDTVLPVILLPAHPASFAHNFVSGMQSFYFIESQDAIVLHICH